MRTQNTVNAGDRVACRVVKGAATGSDERRAGLDAGVARVQAGRSKSARRSAGTRSSQRSGASAITLRT